MIGNKLKESEDEVEVENVKFENLINFLNRFHKISQISLIVN